ncbi:fatty acid-binding protein, intestinal-like [Saccostrea echinata]|uniref:fatty acid-binding protein, intestinal-like n=1 Tax=Saccostrea echinata TaxID=191078 RepID=UPI002A81AF0B|nr:fatty acid-binding protein, intestinal-like [Saccostrea echinata]
MALEEIKNKFEGNWQCVEIENMDPFLEAMGVNIIKRKAAAVLKPNLIITVKDGKMEFVRKLPMKEVRNQFALDEEIEVSEDGHKYKAKVSYSDGKMMIELKAVDGKSKDNVVVREIEGENLIQTATCNGVIAKTIFKKS